jgi:DHA1 family bicyclomycin/chloramphenicol resistance-like MFS transporter
MDSYGLSTTAYALSFAGLSLCFALGAQINMRMLRRRSVASLLRASVVIQVAASVSVLIGALLHVGLVGFLLPMVIALMTVAGVNSNGMALALDPFPRGAASAAALVGGLQMVMGALASALLSAMTLQPSEEMGLGMTLAGSVSLTIIVVALLRGRARSATTT